MNGEMELEIFRAGDYGDKGRWDEAALEAVARDYDPALHEAPVTLDHAQTGPALGWVGGLRRSGDRLVARLRGVNARLGELLRQGAFKKRSAELYRRLPETGRPYLKALSFLGAGSPAVKGLRDALFAERSGRNESKSENGGERGRGEFCAFEFRENPDAPDPLPAPEGDATESKPRPDAQNIEARFDELRGELARSGRWAPGWNGGALRAFFGALAGLEPVEIDGERVEPARWFADFLRAMPPWVPMGEAAPAAPGWERETLPDGGRVSPASVALHRRVVQLRESRPELGYAEALIECGRETAGM